MAATTGKAKEAFKKLSDGAGVTKKNSAGAVQGLKKIKDSAAPLAKSIFTVANMFKLMVLRMAMRAVINAVKAGFQDLAQYSKSFNNTMSSLSTSMLQARNALAAAVAPALQALTPIIISVTNAFVSAMNVIGAFSARLFGNAATFTKAKKAQVDYAKSVSQTNKAMDKQLAGFDELNVLSQEDTGMPRPSQMFEEAAIPEETLTLADRLKSVFAEMMEPLKSIDFSNLTGAFDKVREAAAPLTKNLFDGLRWAYDNVFVPFSKWYIEELLPRWLGLVAEGMEIINRVIEIAKPAWEWIWENVLNPIAEWAGGVFLETLDLLGWALGEFTDWLEENGGAITEVLINIGEIFKIIWERYVKPNLQLTWDFIKLVFTNVVEFAKNFLKNIIQVLGGLTEFVLGVFTGDWERAWNGVKEIFKGVWNGMVTIVESAVNLIIDAVNWMIEKINAISFENPFKKGERIGFNFSPIGKVQIPRLATGAVIPPNAEFLAVLGDQKRGVNIETPLDTMVQAFRTALSEGQGSSQGANITLVLDGRTVGKVVIDQINGITQRTGVSPILI